MSNEKIKISSNRSFGIVFFIFFLFIGLYPILNNNSIRFWSLAIAILFLILGILNSNYLSPLNKIWFKFGIFLSKFISPFIVGLIFFFVVTPTGLLMRMIGIDLLNLKFNKKKSYWINKSDANENMKNQY